MTGQVSEWNSFSVTFTVVPAGSAPGTSQTVLVPSAVTNNGRTYTGPTGSFTIKGESTPAFSTTVTESNLEWSGDYSHTTQTRDLGWLKYQVVFAGETSKGWSVQVSASDFVRTEGGDGIPKANLQLTSSSNPDVAGMSRPSTSGSLGSSMEVLQAPTAVPAGTYEQTLYMSLNIPGGTFPGTYTSEITITAAAAP